MHKPTDRFRSRIPREPAELVIYTDDGGSGLLDACRERFAPPEYEVSCDVRHTVWVRSADGGHSLGIAPWQLRTRSMEEVLHQAEVKLEAARSRSL